MEMHENYKEKNRVEQSFFNLLSEAIFVFCDSKLVLANDKALKLVGVEKLSMLIGKEIEYCIKVHPDYVQHAKAREKRLENGEYVEPTEEKLIRFDGKIIDVEGAGAPYLYNGKRSVMIVLREATDYRKMESKLRDAEQSLSESERRYRKLVELSPNAIFIYNDNKIIQANRAASELVGVSEQEIIGKDITKLMRIHPESAKKLMPVFNQFQNPEITVPFFEQKMIKEDGTEIDVEAAGSTFMDEGRIYKTIIARDITERKRAEQDRRRLNEALEYDKLKTEFFANLSHELRTPLNIILGTIQLMSSMDTKGRACEYHNKFLRYNETMKQNCYRLLRLINNLIDVTRLDAGFLKMNFGNYNIVSLTEDICMSVADYIQSKGLYITFDTDMEEMIISCDADKIERVLLNLLSNAIKFTRPGGKIFVSIYDKRDKVEIVVKDTGIGIPEDMLQQIFERFRQVDPLFTRANEGSGIGLSLVKSIVEAHEGNISVNSMYGVGSEFVISLPVKLASQSENAFLDKAISEKVERISIEFSDIYG